MGYLINTARPSSLLINGTNYIDNLLSFQVSDTSAFRNGIITTSGEIVLGSMAGDDLQDYNRDDFRRGQPVLLTITYPSGDSGVHPRGRLQVISSNYNPEGEIVTLEVGCDLVMAKLLKNDDVVLSFEEVPLDESAKTFEGIASSLATAGKFIYQDSQGLIQSDDYLGASSIGVPPTGLFTSVRGVTAIAVQPLAATEAIPDEIELSYQYPIDVVAGDNQGRVDTVETESRYFVRYPATVFERIKGATVDLITIASGGSIQVPGVTIPGTTIATACGTTPIPPVTTPGFSVNVPGQETVTQVAAPCSVGYVTKASPQFIPAKRTETRITHYAGPAAQTSLQTSEIYGPVLEMNSQFYADKFAYCGSTYANKCLPSPCPMYGTEEGLLGKQQTQYFYGTSAEVVKTVTTTWRPKLAAAQPTDWRSGIRSGAPQDFDNDFDRYAEDLYKHQVVIREFETSDNEKIQRTTTHTSVASRGGGIGAELDAYKGIETSEIRRSTTSVTAEVRPDSINTATTKVKTEKTTQLLNGRIGGYVSTAGPLILEEDAPIPLLYESAYAVNRAVNIYGNYLATFVQGDARGLVIAEGLRQDIGDNWTPNIAFNYYDPNSDKLMVMRADACSWGVDASGCIVALSGIWLSDIEGNVYIPDNTTGVVRPDMDGDNPTPVDPDPVREPIVTNPSIVNTRFSFSVNVHLHASALMTPSGADGIRPAPIGRQDVTFNQTWLIFCKGQIVSNGAMVAVNPDGSVNLTADGEIVIDEENIIVDDSVLFPSIPS